MPMRGPVIAVWNPDEISSDTHKTSYCAGHGEEESADEEVAQPEVQIRVEGEAGKAFARPGAWADATAQRAILKDDVGAKGGDGERKPQWLVVEARGEATDKIEADKYALDVPHLKLTEGSEWNQDYRPGVTARRQRPYEHMTGNRRSRWIGRNSPT